MRGRCPKLGGIYPGLGGDLKGRVRVTAAAQQAPRVNVDLASSRLAYAGTVLKKTAIGAMPGGDKPRTRTGRDGGEPGAGTTTLSQIA